MAVKKEEGGFLSSEAIPTDRLAGDSVGMDPSIQLFSIEIEVAERNIDALGHANNAAYVQWMEQVSWAHSQSLGIDLDLYQRLRRAMVIRRHELDYLAPSFLGDRIRAGTWIHRCDNKFFILRNFLFNRIEDGETLLRGATTFVCIDLDSGRPRRMPMEFVTAYGSAAQEQGKINRPGS